MSSEILRVFTSFTVQRLECKVYIFLLVSAVEIGLLGIPSTPASETRDSAGEYPCRLYFIAANADQYCMRTRNLCSMMERIDVKHILSTSLRKLVGDVSIVVTN